MHFSNLVLFRRRFINDLAHSVPCRIKSNRIFILKALTSSHFERTKEIEKEEIRHIYCVDNNSLFADFPSTFRIISYHLKRSIRIRNANTRQHNGTSRSKTNRQTNAACQSNLYCIISFCLIFDGFSVSIEGAGLE